MKSWYAVYTNTRMESWARSNLWERGFEVYLPMYQKKRRHARKVDIVARPLFPRYLFVEADLEAGQKPMISSAPGVGYLVAFGRRPSPVVRRLIDEIRSRENASGYVQISDVEHMRRGDKVRIEDGALCDQVGLFDGVSDDRRVIILLDLLGRQVRVKLPQDAVRRAG